LKAIGRGSDLEIVREIAAEGFLASYGTPRKKAGSARLGHGVVFNAGIERHRDGLLTRAT